MGREQKKIEKLLNSIWAGRVIFLKKNYKYIHKLTVKITSGFTPRNSWIQNGVHSAGWVKFLEFYDPTQH